MSAAVKRLDGIQSVEVSYGEARATIRCRADSKATIDSIRSAIRAAGFTPGAAEAEIVGRVVERDGRPGLEVAGAVYPLVGDAAALQASVGKTATVRVRVPAGKVAALQVVSIH